MKRIAFLRKDDAGKRAGEHNMSWLKCVTVRADLVGKPCHAKGRMTEYAGSETCFFNFGIAGHDAAHPAQIDVERADRPAAHRNAGGRAIVRNGIDNLARVLDPRVDDLDRRHHVFGGAQDIGETDTGALQLLAHDEGELHLHTGLAVVGVLHLGAIGDQLIVEDVTVVGFVDHRRALHRL